MISKLIRVISERSTPNSYFSTLIIVLMLLAIEVANMYLGYNVNAYFI